MRCVEHSGDEPGLGERVTVGPAARTAPVVVGAVSQEAVALVDALLEERLGRFASDGDGVALDENPASATGEWRGVYVHCDDWKPGCRDLPHRRIGTGYADDEAVRAASDLVAHGGGRELVERTVDGERPAAAIAQVLENTVELVLAGDAGHAQRDHDAFDICSFAHAPNYSRSAGALEARC